MATQTPNYAFNLPTVGSDEDAWGTLLNANWTSVDSLFQGFQDGYLPLIGGTLTGALSIEATDDVVVFGDATVVGAMQMYIGTDYTGLVGFDSSTGSVAPNFGTRLVYRNDADYGWYIGPHTDAGNAVLIKSVADAAYFPINGGTFQPNELFVENGDVGTEMALTLSTTDPLDPTYDSSGLRVATNGRLLVYSGENFINGFITAVFDEAGPAVSGLVSVITKEKGDALYAPLGGEDRTWADVTAQRTAGATYENTTGGMLTVNMKWSSAGGNTQKFQVSTDGVANWITLAENGGAASANVSAVIPAGHFYRINAGGISFWSELR